MKKIPLSLQLWSVRDLTASDFRGTVLKVAELGYAGVELAGYGNLDAARANAALREAGLAVSGMHVTIDRLRNELPKVMEEASLLSARDIICPYIEPAAVATAAQCQAFGQELDRIGAQAVSAGFRFSYHNHGHEVAAIEGRSIFERVLDAADPKNLAAQLDVYWVHFAGEKPADFLRRLGRRVPLIHLKDGREGGRQCEVGSGVVDFPAIFQAVEEIGAVEWYVVEQEEFEISPLGSAGQSLAQLRTWGKA